MYKESIDIGNKYRQEYRQGVENLVRKMVTKSKENRERIIDGIKKEPEKYREMLQNMLGWPLNEVGDELPPKVNKIFVAKRGEVSIYRMQIHVLEIPFYGILFVKDDNKKRPMVIAQHGGLGSPEECGNLLESGTANYNDMIDRVLKYDVNVFAPQLLLWRQEFSYDEYKGVDISYTDAMRRSVDNELKQLGSSITALEIFCLKRAVDFFENEPYVEDGKFGMIGMSYGGFYALYTAAVDKRIKCCISSSFFNNRLKYNWPDWVWFNSGNSFTDAEVALLVQPRPLYICIGNKDEVFDFDSAVNYLNEFKNSIYDEEKIHFVEFDGTHEFIKDDKVIQNFISDLFNS